MGKILSVSRVVKFVDTLFGAGLHHKQIVSLGNAVTGLLYAPRLGSAAIGRALAALNDTTAKHSIKQVDRLIGNGKIALEFLWSPFVLWVIGVRNDIVVSMDWTEYGGSKQSRIALNLITSHGRATPLLWKTYSDSKLKSRRSLYERRILKQLKRVIPATTLVTIIADRGFASTKLYRFIAKGLEWQYVIRFRQNTKIMTSEGIQAPVWAMVAHNGRVVELTSVAMTGKKEVIPAVIYTRRKGMKEPWCLATNIVGTKERVVSLYGRRFTCEENFRDEKDDRFGLGSKETRVTTCDRRDRMLFIAVITMILLTILGAVGEQLGYDRMLRANTEKKRTHSCFRQGREYVLGITRQHVHRFLALFEHLLMKQPENSLSVYII
jgi:hypothetical protein